MSRMRFGWLLLLLVGVGVSLACNLVNSAMDPGPMRLNSVDVVPGGGDNRFSASVAIGRHTKPGDMQCYIPMQGKGPDKTVFKGSVPANDTSHILTFDFSMSEPGTYTLYCTALEVGMSEKTQFTVPEPPAAATPSAPAPTGKAPSVSPQVIKGTGSKVSIADSGSCSSPQQVALTIQADLSAELVAIGPGFVDHVNCKASGSNEGWYIAGTVDPSSETVTFNGCNKGGFNASGSVRFSGGVLSGSATCLYNKGASAGKPAMRLTIP